MPTTITNGITMLANMVLNLLEFVLEFAIFLKFYKTETQREAVWLLLLRRLVFVLKKYLEKSCYPKMLRKGKLNLG